MNPFYGENTVIADLVYSARSANVDTTIVDGKVLMQNRQVRTIDLPQIIGRTHQIAGELARA
jgi:5-methylthioadenosine/S-adenosylhomocysteine deaminase